jgi:hypothetical protein
LRQFVHDLIAKKTSTLCELVGENPRAFFIETR